MTSYYASPSSPLDFPCPQQRNNNHKNFIISGGKNIFYRTLTRCDSRTLHINKPRHVCFFYIAPKTNYTGLDPPPLKRHTNFLGVIVVATLLGTAPAGTALLAATLLRTALGRTPGRLPLAALLGGRLAARGTSLGRHGSTD